MNNAFFRIAAFAILVLHELCILVDWLCLAILGNVLEVGSTFARTRYVLEHEIALVYFHWLAIGQIVD